MVDEEVDHCEQAEHSSLNEDDKKISSRSSRKSKVPKQKKGIKCKEEFTDHEDRSSLSHITSSTSLMIPYCPNCDFPQDFCEFGPCWELCKEASLRKFPQFYTHYLTKEGLAPPHQTLPNKAVDTVQKKKPVESKKMITIQRIYRAKNKVTTIITGLELYDIKLDAVAKLFKKKFACGCSAAKGTSGAPNYIEVQGDVESEADALLLSNFPEISAEDIVHNSLK